MRQRTQQLRSQKATVPRHCKFGRNGKPPRAGRPGPTAPSHVEDVRGLGTVPFVGSRQAELSVASTSDHSSAPRRAEISFISRGRIEGVSTVWGGGLPGEVQHLQEEGGELETYCFTSGKKGLQWDITNSPRGNGT